jgi:hypothetical protein
MRTERGVPISASLSCGRKMGVEMDGVALFTRPRVTRPTEDKGPNQRPTESDEVALTNEQVVFCISSQKSVSSYFSKFDKVIEPTVMWKPVLGMK